jgi:general secretion pathway protein D
MTPAYLNWKRYCTGALAFGLCATLPLIAQIGPPGGGFGSFGGFGGTRSRSSANSQYPRNGDIGNATVSIDPETHNLVVIADEETLAHISGVVSNLDLPQPQVLIKVVFLEVQRNTGLDLGIDAMYRATTGTSPSTTTTTNYTVLPTYSMLGSNTVQSGSSIIPSSISTVTSYLPTSFFTGTNMSGLSGLTGGGTGLYQFMGPDYNVTLHAIATAGNAKILSRPSIVARNNQPASILVGQSVPLITSVRYDTFGNAINGVQYTDVGIILRVTPFITSEGMVQMILTPETSTVSKTDYTTISASANGVATATAPYINKRSADTVVVTPDGQTVIIGGLIQDAKAESESKVPFLGDIPLLGNLFKRKITSDVKTELVIFLTPRIIPAPMAIASLSATERAKSDAVKALSQRELERFLDTLPTKKDSKSKGKKPVKPTPPPPPASPN